MADPVTLMTIGAVGGAMLNPNDPVKGAVMGGALGYGGGALMGAGAAGGAAAGTTVGAGGIGGAGTGLTATTLGGSVPASAGLGTAAGGATGITATANPVAASFGGLLGSGTPAAAGMGGGTGLLGTASTSAMSASPFAVAAPTMLSSPSILGGSTRDQIMAANMLIGKGSQQPQPLPRAPAIQSRPYTGMKQPVQNAQMQEEMLRKLYAMPAMPQIRLI